MEAQPAFIAFGLFNVFDFRQQRSLRHTILN
jgi:hypothetical protein